jgi:hypothetical protein
MMGEQWENGEKTMMMNNGASRSMSRDHGEKNIPLLLFSLGVKGV